MRALISLLTFLFLLMACSARGVQQVPLKAWEEREPIVKVCPTAPVTTSEVQWALDTWAEHGAPQLQAVSSYCLDIAESSDAVFVTGPQPWAEAEWTPGTIGLTVTFSETREGPTRLGVIGLATGDLRVLTHEVGHLWITGHVGGPFNPHIMAEYIQHFDWDGWDGIDKAMRRL